MDKELKMTDHVHGHEVMKMMVEAKKEYTRESLKADIIDQFGEQTRFYTCSAEGMTPDELITLLDHKGKFLKSDTGFTTDPNRICDH